jgi:hypothetical protein
VGPTQLPIQWNPGALPLEVKRPVREADRSPPSSAKVKNAWSYTSTPPCVFMAWYLLKRWDNFAFTLPSGLHTEVKVPCRAMSRLTVQIGCKAPCLSVGTATRLNRGHPPQTCPSFGRPSQSRYCNGVWVTQSNISLFCASIRLKEAPIWGDMICLRDCQGLFPWS